MTALAHSMRARVAMAASDEISARQEIKQVLATIKGREAPLAASRSILRGLSSALDENSPLGQAFLSAKASCYAAG